METYYVDVPDAHSNSKGITIEESIVSGFSFEATVKK